MSKNNIYVVDQVDTYTTAEFDKILSECDKVSIENNSLYTGNHSRKARIKIVFLF